MFRLDHDGDAAGAKRLHERVGDLQRQMFLDLQTPRKNVDNPRHFRKSNDLSARNIGDVRLPNEREQMVLTHRIKLDVFHEDNFARIGIENGIVDDLVQALPVTVREELESARGAVRRSE